MIVKGSAVDEQDMRADLEKVLIPENELQAKIRELAAQIDAVFGSFVRLEQSRNRQTGGLGLGLTIARNIARAAGGEISLSNNPGGGLLTQLRLPLAA